LESYISKVIPPFQNSDLINKNATFSFIFFYFIAANFLTLDLAKESKGRKKNREELDKITEAITFDFSLMAAAPAATTAAVSGTLA